MTTTAIRKKLMAYIAVADEKKVKGLYMLIENDLVNDGKFKLSDHQLKLLKQDEQKHLKGKSKSYNWEEAKQIIRGKRKL
jgi:hypothetical protein